MNTTLTIKTDKKLRDDARRVAHGLGLPLTTAVNAMLKQFVRDRRLVLEEECPFPSHTPNAETRKALLNVRHRKGLKTFATFEEFEKHVRSL
ncbi:type II toxin-antitoxin system RelB/DinJ family antitoxin [Candidatus Kaiserbacteria bacterium]|nr:type II toxin-antitoxin system RelB/DinJ family antitoxin [Candidatus Kaiserbacteria bacterium]